MPILPLEPDLYPENLFEQLDAAAGREVVRWWAMYTLPRREKDLMRRLRVSQIAHYGPLVVRKSRAPSGRVRSAAVPLFSGYVFVVGDETQRYAALTTHCVSRCLEVPDGSQLAADLRQIRRLITSGAPLTPEARLEAGMRVRIRSGSLAGLEGTVVRRRGSEKLLVAVRFLQQGASIELADYAVERIDP